MRLLRRLILFLIILGAIYILLFISINFIFQAPLKRCLEKMLGASFDAKINIQNLKTDLLTQVNLSQIQINRTLKKPAFLLALSSFNFKYSPLSIFRSRFIGLEAFGDFSIRAFNYNQLSLNNLSSKLYFFDKKMRFENLKADTLGGRLQGELNLSLSDPIGYGLELKMLGLNLKEITRTFAPPDWQATGIIDGDLKVSIEGKELKDLQGKLYSRGTGTMGINAIKGLLSRARVIMDKKVLERDIISYEKLTGNISLHKNEIIIELNLVAKEIDLIFDIKIEPEVFGSFLIERR